VRLSSALGESVPADMFHLPFKQLRNWLENPQTPSHLIAKIHNAKAADFRKVDDQPLFIKKNPERPQ